MELVLVRHARPERIDGPVGSRADPGLSPLGVEQAQRLADLLAVEPVDALYVSPLRRARETATPLAGKLGLDPVLRDGIAEFDSGDHSYVPVEELRASGDPRWHALVRGDLYSAGVDPEEFRDRVVAAVEEVVAAHPGQRVVLVTHAGVLNAWGGHVLGQQRPIWFAPAYVSVSRFAAGRTGRRSVVSLNETAHVRDLLG